MKNEAIYVRIAQQLKEFIMQEKHVNDKLKSEAELCREYRVSKVTIRRALNVLLAEDLIYKKQGKGTFVKRKDILYDNFSISINDTFSLHAKKHKLTSHTDIILFKVIHANNILSKALRIKIADKVFHIKRIRYIANEPSILEDSYLVESLFPGLTEEDLTNRSIVDYVGKHYKVSKIFRTIIPIVSDADTSKVLRITLKEPILKARVINYLEDDIIYEFSNVYYNPHKYTLAHTINFE